MSQLTPAHIYACMCQHTPAQSRLDLSRHLSRDLLLLLSSDPQWQSTRVCVNTPQECLRLMCQGTTPAQCTLESVYRQQGAIYASGAQHTPAQSTLDVSTHPSTISTWCVNTPQHNPHFGVSTHLSITPTLRCQHTPARPPLWCVKHTLITTSTLMCQHTSA